MSDSEDDDWFSKDLKDFVAPRIVQKCPKAEITAENTQISRNPYKNLLLNPNSDSGGAYSQSSHSKSKSRFANNQKILPVRLKKLLEKPLHIIALDLFTNQDKWENTLLDFCDLKDTHGLDICMELLGKIVTSSVKRLALEMVKRSCNVSQFFTFYIKSRVRGQGKPWQYYALTMELMKSIGDLIRSGELALDWITSFEIDLKIPTLPPVVERSLLPKLKDLTTNDQGILEPVPIRGSITDLTKYLHNQMNLLRAEFMKDLRLLIEDIRNEKSDHFYSNIHLKCRDNIEVYILDPPAPFDNYIHGNLLICSTSTSFEDMILATVIEYNSLNRELRIELLSLENIQVDIFTVPLIMVVSPVFFEPFHRVHQRLVEILSDTLSLPFQEIFMDLNKSSKCKVVQKVNPTITGLYPRQVEAVLGGVTQRLTLIQGPPGTGKSFVGLKIVENLLRNNKKDKILILSVTNHALDEVLKGLLRTTQNIVRFGTQSKERELDGFNIRNVSGDLNPLIRSALAVAHEKCQPHLDKTNLNDFLRKRRIYLEILKEIKDIDYFNRIESLNVVGMTTTAAARLHALLELYKPRVLIVEEAAEILECHLIAALTKSLEQIVLIGDHHQLRATLQDPSLATKYNFDVSLFERLICNDMGIIQLDQQSRMRPELADLIRGVFYESYSNSPSVYKDLPNTVRGMDKNIYFFDHRETERTTASKSKANELEATMSLHLVDYLLKQGYTESQMVILSFYNGQLDLLQGLRYAEFQHLKEVRIRTVDNFQGEESDIVVLNAVRSNMDNAIGYVGVKNRICTAMTRSKYGLFIFGNAMALSEASSVWREIINRLCASGCQGDVLPLRCERHGTLIKVRDVEDFKVILRKSAIGNLCNNCD